MRNEAAAQRSKVVDGLIQQLGLSKAAHTKIGDARSRGVSGGERKVSDTLYTSSGDMCMRVVCLCVVKGGKGRARASLRAEGRARAGFRVLSVAQ